MLGKMLERRLGWDRQITSLVSLLKERDLGDLLEGAPASHFENEFHMKLYVFMVRAFRVRRGYSPNRNPPLRPRAGWREARPGPSILLCLACILGHVCAARLCGEQPEPPPPLPPTTGELQRDARGRGLRPAPGDCTPAVSGFRALSGFLASLFSCASFVNPARG